MSKRLNGSKKMDSKKVKEIKKALEFMMKLDLSNKLPYIDGKTIKQIAYEEIFNYINELESENERLQEQNGVLIRDLDYLNGKFTNAETEIDRQKDRIAKLEKGNEDYYDRLNNLQKYIDNHEEIWKGNTNNALKKFAERLKEKIVFMKWAREDTYEKLIKQGATIKAIDETLKEFLDGKV